jgi:small subunit ribosomal protein S18
MDDPFEVSLGTRSGRERVLWNVPTPFSRLARCRSGFHNSRFDIALSVLRRRYRPNMATLNRIEIRKRRKKRARLKKKLRCRFCPDGCNHSPRPIYVDFKDLKTLRLMIDREGHIQSRRRTGNCAKYQRAVRRAVLMARFMGLLPYVSEE